MGRFSARPFFFLLAGNLHQLPGLLSEGAEQTQPQQDTQVGGSHPPPHPSSSKPASSTCFSPLPRQICAPLTSLPLFFLSSPLSQGELPVHLLVSQVPGASRRPRRDVGRGGGRRRGDGRRRAGGRDDRRVSERKGTGERKGSSRRAAALTIQKQGCVVGSGGEELCRSGAARELEAGPASTCPCAVCACV